MLPSTVAIAAEGTCDHWQAINFTHTELLSTTATCDGPVWAFQPFVNPGTGHRLAVYAFMRRPQGVHHCYDYPFFDCPPASENCTNLMLSGDYCNEEGQEWWNMFL